MRRLTAIFVLHAALAASEVRKNVPIPMRDGVKLTADIYLPDGPGPFPVLLSRTPYDKTRRVIRAEKFTRNGHAVAISNVFFPHDDDQSAGS